MPPYEFVVFGIALFLALTLLFKWKRRRDQNGRRMNRGLRSYVSSEPLALAEADAAAEEMIVAQGNLT